MARAAEPGAARISFRADALLHQRARLNSKTTNGGSAPAKCRRPGRTAGNYLTTALGRICRNFVEATAFGGSAVPPGPAPTNGKNPANNFDAFREAGKRNKIDSPLI